jgi:hypothetical protein
MRRLSRNPKPHNKTPRTNKSLVAAGRAAIAPPQNLARQKQKSLARITRLIATLFLAKSVSFDQPGQVS